MTDVKQVENRLCNRCGSNVSKSDLKEYAYQCFECDEDLYTFETHLPRNDNDSNIRYKLGGK